MQSLLTLRELKKYINDFNKVYELLSKGKTSIFTKNTKENNYYLFTVDFFKPKLLYIWKLAKTIDKIGSTKEGLYIFKISVPLLAKVERKEVNSLYKDFRKLSDLLILYRKKPLPQNLNLIKNLINQLSSKYKNNPYITQFLNFLNLFDCKEIIIDIGYRNFLKNEKNQIIPYDLFLHIKLFNLIRKPKTLTTIKTS